MHILKTVKKCEPIVVHSPGRLLSVSPSLKLATVKIQTAQLINQFLLEIPDRKTELAAVMEMFTFQSGNPESSLRNRVISSLFVGHTAVLSFILLLGMEFTSFINRRNVPGRSPRLDRQS